jgi:vanillate O-demethylase ferredoxin subunit
MWSLETGAELRVSEPANHFELPLGAPQYLLLAGGIGITPIVGMAQQLSARGADVRMLYAAREAQELAFADVLRDALGDKLQTFVDAEGQRIEIKEHIAALHPQALLLICGPMPLLDAVRTAWQAAGRPPANLRFETFGNTGALASEAFWVELPRHGLKLEVPADRTLLDVLTEAGVEALFDCQRGECGLCAMDIVSAHGTIDHRDVFFSAHEKQANQRLCACVSRVTGGGVVLDSAFRTD